MFWSKIWFFLVAVVAAAAIVIALVMPRPAERAALENEGKLLERACSITNILLRDNARARIQLAGEFARADAPPDSPGLRIDDIVYEASRKDEITAASNSTGRKALNYLLEKVKGTKPDFVTLLDRSGRAVARWGRATEVYGDSLAGYHVVDDALHGYLRDDLWLLDGTLYRVAAAPMVTRQREWAGAIVLGHAVDKELTDSLSKNLDVDISFYVSGEPVATSVPAQIHEGVLAEYESIGGAESRGEVGSDCDDLDPFTVTSGPDRYTALISRLPGEAGALGGFYTVFVERAEGIGLNGTLAAVKKEDLGLSSFPWIPVALGFVVVVAAGLGILWFEGDRPLRRLNGEAIELAKAERERLEEERHGGKYGSIARSVNIAVDKLRRDAKSARKDLDELLGPSPEGGALGASPLPPSGPGGPGAPAPPPPSEFKFGDSAGPGAARAGSDDPLGLSDAPPGASAQPSPPPARTPPPTPAGAGARDNTPPPIPIPPKGAKGKASARAIDDDILGGATQPDDDEFDAPTTVAAADAANPDGGGDDEAHFRQIFQEFLSLKEQCGENTASLTFEKFAGKLRSNRDALMAKHGCKTVRFQVYVKDGKAALKASPVKA